MRSVNGLRQVIHEVADRLLFFLLVFLRLFLVSLLVRRYLLIHHGLLFERGQLLLVRFQLFVVPITGVLEVRDLGLALGLHDLELVLLVLERLLRALHLVDDGKVLVHEAVKNVKQKRRIFRAESLIVKAGRHIEQVIRKQVVETFSILLPQLHRLLTVQRARVLSTLGEARATGSLRLDREVLGGSIVTCVGARLQLRFNEALLQHVLLFSLLFHGLLVPIALVLFVYTHEELLVPLKNIQLVFVFVHFGAQLHDLLRKLLLQILHMPALIHDIFGVFL